MGLETKDEMKGYELSKTIEDEMFKLHTHGDLVDDEEIVYKEKDVLQLLKMLEFEIRLAYVNNEFNIGFKEPIDICIIDDVYKSMIQYKKEKSKNQQRQLAVSCEMIKKILINSLK